MGRVFGLVGLLLALVIVGLLVKKQLGTLAGPPAAPAAASAPGIAAPAAGNPRQVQEQFKQSLDAAMQQPRAMPDEAQ